MRKKIYFIFALTIFSSALIGQTDLVSRIDPALMNALPRYSVSDGQKYNEVADYNHPDFGMMTFNAPFDKRVVEVISKRTLDERYYIDLDEPLFFYIEKSSRPINFFDGEHLRAIDPSMHKMNEFYYESGAQVIPTALDLLNKRILLKPGTDVLGFANLTLEKVDVDGNISYEEANWSDIQIGNFETYITDIFNHIDFKITFREGGFKTEFIIKQNLNVKELHFVDSFDLPEKYTMTMNGSGVDSLFVQLYNTETGETDFVIEPARTKDQSGIRTSWLNPYIITDNTLTIVCDSMLLNSTSNIYPLVIDPLFTAVGPITSALGVMGSLASPSFCSNSLVVSFPGGSTPWDVSAEWEVFTDFCAGTSIDWGFYDDCYMSDAQLWLTSSCGGASPAGAPGTIWSCTAPGCATIGTWNPTLPFGSSGTQSLAQCYSPSCSNQNLTFTINDNRSYCTSAYGYDLCAWANSYCVSLDQWSVTVQGRSVETLGNSVTGNGSQTINDPDCIGTATLNPTPLYGVPGYTYNWNTGATTSTINVPVTPAVYTATVTDACGNSVVATFNVGCPLPLRLENFTAYQKENFVEISWTSLDESGMKNYVLEHSLDGVTYSAINSVSPIFSAQNNYQQIHNEASDGINYYRLKIVYDSQEVEYTDPVAVYFTRDKAIIISPNPASQSVKCFLNESLLENSSVQIISPSGKIELNHKFVSEINSKEFTLDVSKLPSGIYTLKVFNGNKVITEQLVINR